MRAFFKSFLADAVEASGGFEFATLGAATTPVGETVAPCEEEGELDAEPLTRCVEAEGRGEVDGRGDQSDGDDARAGEIEEAHEKVGDEAAGEARDGQSVEKGGVTGNEAEERGREEEAKNDADGFGAG